MTGKLLILSAPSGAGKSSLAKALTDSLPDTVVSVSHTTRAPRPGEQDGVHYHFIDRADFERMAAAGEFIEHARVFDNFYGTARAAVERELQAGRNVLLDIDWQGARRIKQQMPQAVSVFILPPSRATLEQRLRARGQDAEAVIARRMRDAVAEMRRCAEFDNVVVNDDFQTALADLTAIVRGRPAAARRVALDMDELLREPVEKTS
ncbi:MAG: guanylate kinase [Candidatus Muproteobacteria bacterium RBG_16_64_10]|uniref:Guanylate kinase n=1 Tax=Candidatus Muproteobacteria bacterium RBG_16_64_10 TaxID=1817757 RepID=A0A1F6T478_9PROT|nr:MAG: guanylate kinase [Candidatus Muproteobacteria bacterium RBG_16_64_10]